jgi:hypothetical protein
MPEESSISLHPVALPVPFRLVASSPSLAIPILPCEMVETIMNPQVHECQPWIDIRKTDPQPLTTHPHTPLLFPFKKTLLGGVFYY